MRRSPMAPLTTSIVLLGLAVGGTAWARTIVVLRPDASDVMLTESFSRLCGELHMYGLQVSVPDGAVDDARALLLDNPPSKPGGAPDVVGAVTLVRTAGQASANIWIAEPGSPRESVHITVSVENADAASLLAIRAADVVRASLRDGERAQAQVHPGTEAAAILPESKVGSAGEKHGGSQRWRLGIGASMLWESGALGSGFSPLIQGERRLTPRLSLSLSFAGPHFGQSYAGKLATARVRQQLEVLALGVRLVQRTRFSLDVFQGFGAAQVAVHGAAQSPWVGQSSSAWAAASSTGACVGLGLSEHVGISLGLAAVLILPQPVLEVADVSYRMHQPLLLATAGMVYGF